MSLYKLIARTARPAILRVVKPALKRAVQGAVTTATGSPFVGKIAGEVASVALEVAVKTLL